MEPNDVTNSEWLDKGRVDDIHYWMVHKRCGTAVFVQRGQTPVCPKCQPGALSRQPSERPKKA